MSGILTLSEFDALVVRIAEQCCYNATHIELYNGSLYVQGCTPANASRMQTKFADNGIGVIVTPGDVEYAFDFV